MAVDVTIDRTAGRRLKGKIVLAGRSKARCSRTCGRTAPAGLRLWTWTFTPSEGWSLSWSSTGLPTWWTSSWPPRRTGYSRPVHLFGAGHPMVFALAALLGCDMFDSASYAKFARDDRFMFPRARPASGHEGYSLSLPRLPVPQLQGDAIWGRRTGPRSSPDTTCGRPWRCRGEEPCGRLWEGAWKREAVPGAPLAPQRAEAPGKHQDFLEGSSPR